MSRLSRLLKQVFQQPAQAGGSAPGRWAGATLVCVGVALRGSPDSACASSGLLDDGRCLDGFTRSPC